MADNNRIIKGQKAAVLTLDYGDGNMEFSVLYYSDVWEELIKILDDPKGFFKEVCGEYTIDIPTNLPVGTGGRVADWNFGEGAVTAIFINSKRNKNSLEKLATLGAGSEGDTGVMLSAFMPAPAATFESLEEATKGTFMAEYAIGTKTLTITYNPGSPKDGRYRAEQLSSIVLAFPDISVNDEEYCSFHADLEPGAASRTAFAMAYLESPESVAKMFTDRSKSPSGRAPTAEGGPTSALSLGAKTPLMARPVDLAAGKPKMTIGQLQNLSVEDAKKHSFAFQDLDNRNNLLIIEGLGENSDSTFGCVHCSLNANHTGDHVFGGEHVLGSMTIKNYLEEMRTLVTFEP